MNGDERRAAISVPWGMFTCMAWLLAASAAAACGQDVGQARHVTLDRDATALRAAFDADSGKVRAVFLAAPT